jgi:hypothetical protein
MFTKWDLSWLHSKRPNKQLKESDAVIFTQAMTPGVELGKAERSWGEGRFWRRACSPN